MENSMKYLALGLVLMTVWLFSIKLGYLPDPVKLDHPQVSILTGLLEFSFLVCLAMMVLSGIDEENTRKRNLVIS